MRAERILIVAAVAALAGLFILALGGCGGSAEAESESGHDETESHGHSEGHGSGHGEGHKELAPHMAQMQRFSQKLGYAIEGENAELADFYLHEIEELVDTLAGEFPDYEDLPIKKNVQELFAPRVEPVGEAIDAGDWEQAGERYGRLIESCNGCHAATEHPFIRITKPTGEPPYNQDFSAP